ncbi:unnamed protein product [Prorocentrum cordatum]|uniref:EF-hand domain-containing protein n=1 Tax=Prorocentrum cordatum TaxID=2364126 RepID=A0ABN9Y1S3_9DINO|nr:unnamed protein product [Polarella glacialis]
MELHTLCCWAHVGERARAVFTWAHFDVIIGVVIVLNAITIGIETSRRAKNGTSISSFSEVRVASFIQACEYVFMAVYMAELGLNFAALGVRESLRNPWIKLDIFFVVIGVANVALSVFTPDVGHPLGNFNMLKVLRLIRLARIIRLAVQFRTLWLLSCGLIHAVVPMIWTCFFMVVVIYVFAVLGMEMITDTRADRDNEYVMAAQNFNSIADAMLTLWQIMFVDSAASIYRPLMYNNPILILYFLAFFLMGPSSFRVANEDQEAKRAWRTHKRKAMIPKLRELFKTMDLNGNDELDLEEIKANPAAMDQLKNIVDIDQLENLVHLLDQDQTGTISVDEFVEGLVRSCLDERPAELVLLVGHSRRILSAVRELGERRPDPSPGAPGGR